MGLMKKLTSAIVASSLVFTLVGTAAAYQPKDGETAGARMAALKIVTGRDGSGDLQLNSTITRAEFVTVMVRAFGKEDVAKYLTGSTVFPDIANHWASGYIAMAVNIAKENGGDAIGTDKGTFDPNGNLTPAQAVAFLMKFMGVKRDTTKAWPQDYLSAAVTANLITADDATTVAQQGNTNATRGLVFYLLDNAFYTRKDANGETVYTKYAPKAPTLDVAAAKTTTADNQVTISGTAKDAVEVSVGSNKVTLGADGAFTYDYALNMGDNPITVQAKSVAGVTATKNLSVTRTTGTAATVEASLSAELLKAGTTANLTVTVKDKAGNVIKDAAYDVAVTGDIGTYDQATGVFTAAAKPATGSLTITSGDATKNLDVAVVAGDLAKIAVTPATTNVAVGTPVQFTAKGLDAAGNELAGNLNVTWTKTGGVIDAQGNFVGTASGNYTVTATANGVSGTATVTVFGQAVALKLAAVPDLIANETSSQTVTATVVDASGNVVTGYNGAVNFGSSNNTAGKLSDATVNAVNGVATVTVTSNSTSSSSTTFAISASASGLTGATTSVKAAGQTLTSIGATIGTATLGADGVSNTTVTYKELDQAGVEMGTYANVNLAVTNSNTSLVTVPTTLALSGATKTVTVQSVGAAEGSATISATVSSPSDKTGIQVGSVSVSTTQVGVPAAIVVSDVAAVKVDALGVTDAADKTQKIVVKVVDAKGNQVTNPTLNGYVTLAISTTTTTVDVDGNTAAVQNTLTGQNPTGGSFTFNATNTKVGDVTYTVTAQYDADGAGLAASAVDLPSKTAVGHFNPGPVKKLALTGSPLPGTNMLLAADGTMTGTLSASLTDNNDNAMNDGSYTVTFFKTSTGDNGATVDFTDNKATAVTANGAATTTITSTRTQAQDTFQASVKLADGTTIYSNTLAVDTKIIGVVAASEIQAISGNFTAGTSKDVTVAVKDAAGTPNVVVTDNGRAVTLKAYKTSDDTELGTFTGTTVAGVATLPVTLTYAGNVYFKATVDGVSGTVSALNKTVVPAAATKIVLTSDLTTLSADGLSQAKLTATLKDQYDNTATNAANTAVTVKADAISYANFANGAAVGTGITINTTAGVGTTSDAVTGPPAVLATHLQASTLPGTITLTAAGPTGSNLTSGTLQINTIYGGFTAAQYSVDTIADTTTGQNMTVKVYVLDAQGNRVTNYSGNVTLTTTSTHADLDGAGVVNNSVTVAAVKGVATFTVTNITAEAVSFTVSASGSIAAKTATGNFLPAAAQALAITGVSNTAVKADGSSVVTYTVAAQDGNTNTVGTANGTAKVEITDGADYATVLTPTINITGGIGTFQIQTKYRESGKVITVKVSTADMFKADGTTVLTYDTDNSLTVDGVAPALVSSTANAGKTTMTVVFNKSMLEADVENAANWTLTTAAGTQTITGIVYTDATKTAVITLSAAAAANDTLTLKDGAVRDANSFFTMPTFTATF